MSVLFNLDTRTHEHVHGSAALLHNSTNVAAAAVGNDDETLAAPTAVGSSPTKWSSSSLTPALELNTSTLFAELVASIEHDDNNDNDEDISGFLQIQPAIVGSGPQDHNNAPQRRSTMFSPYSSSSSTYDSGIESSSSPAACTATVGGENSDSNSSTLFELNHLGLNDACPKDSQPRLIIREQPVDKFRFRYKSEMHGTHGSLTGASGTSAGAGGKKKTYPTVELVGCTEAAIIYCSLHQTDKYRERLHSHSLVVRHDATDHNDPHDVHVNEKQGYRAEFLGMGIIHTAKKFILDEMYDKLLRREQLLNGQREMTEFEVQRLHARAEVESNQMNLNQVCLCFEAFRLVRTADGGERYERLCEPVYSNPINNMKSALTGELKITRLSATCCHADGNQDLFMFVEKVGKKNIQVRFYEEDDQENIVWQDFGQFAESDVHHQYAIALRTPPYRNLDIEEKVNVFVQLYRKSDHCYSAPLPFCYKPRISTVSRKRVRLASTYNSAELPTVLHEAVALAEPITISKEFNKSELINQLFNKTSEDLLNNYMNANPEEFDNMLDDEDYMNAADYRYQTSDFPSEVVVNDGPNGRRAHAGAMVNNSIEMRVSLLGTHIHKVSRTQSKLKASEYLKRILVLADLLHKALADESGSAAANMVIDLIECFELFEMFGCRDKVNQYYPLHTACLYDRHECIARMLRLGADPNVTDHNSNTPLHFAVIDKFPRCVSAICDSNNYPPSAGSTKLHIDATNDNGYTALHLAIQAKHLDIVQILTAAGASVGKKEPGNGNMSLHMAVTSKSADIVRHLMSATDVDAMERNTSNLTALELAELDANTTDMEILQLLRFNGSSGAGDANDATNVAASLSPKRSVASSSTTTSPAPSPSSDSKVANGRPAHGGGGNQRTPQLFDEICMHDLSCILNADQRWKPLATRLNLGAFVALCEKEADPTRAMFRYAESNGIDLPYVVNVFVHLDDREALGCLDEMIARRMELE